MVTKDKRKTRKRQPKRKELTDQQKLFVKAYLVNLNAVEAATRAGYAHAKSQAYRVLANPLVTEAVRRAKASQMEKFEFDADDVVREISKMGFANMGDFWHREPCGKLIVDALGRPSIDFAKLTPAQTAAITELSYDQNLMPKIKLGSKIGALEALCKRFGLFVERHEHSFNDVDDVDDLGDLEPQEAAAIWHKMIENA